MNRLSASIKIYIGLIISLAILSAIGVFLPQDSFPQVLPEQELPASKPVLAVVNVVVAVVLYGGLGFLGLILSQKLGFTNLWDAKISNRQRFLLPVLVGVGLGAYFILADTIFYKFRELGPLPHPPFPTSIFASAVAGIGEELIFRLFFISFWVWLISHIILRKRWQNQVFWIITILSAVVFALAHIPTVMILFGLKTFNNIPLVLLSEIFLLNGVFSLFAAYYFRKFGFLAAVGIHFWTDLIWHVVWGMI